FGSTILPYQQPFPKLEQYLITCGNASYLETSDQSSCSQGRPRNVFTTFDRYTEPSTNMSNRAYAASTPMSSPQSPAYREPGWITQKQEIPNEPKPTHFSYTNIC